MEKIIALLFLSRDTAHKAHLKSTSYSEHMALNDFYEEVIELADSIAEAYQGRNGLMGDITSMSASKSPGAIFGKSGSTSSNEASSMLRSQLKMLEDMRYKDCDKSETAIQNMIDEVVALFLKTLYKLDNLK